MEEERFLQWRQWAAEQCRWALRMAGLYPARELTAEECTGLERLLIEAARALSLRERMALWLLARAWNGGVY